MTGLMRFFSFEGRASRSRWAAWFALALGLGVAGFLALTRVEGALLVAVYAGLGLVLAKLATESVRRLHDCGQRGWIALAGGLVVFALIAFAVARAVGYGSDPLLWGALGLAVAIVLALYLRPGMARDNAHGPPPPPFRPSGPIGGRAGALAAVALAGAGVAFGLAVLDWQAGRAREAERRVREAGREVAPAEPLDGGGDFAANSGDDELDEESAAALNEIDAMLNGGAR